MRFLISTLLIFLVLACDPNVLFREPQPSGSPDIQKFPARMHGTYLETMGDSSVYVVSSTFIFQKYVEELSQPEAEILEEEGIVIRGDSLILKDINMSFKVIRRNDSIFGTVTFYDTIFDLSAKYKLRKFRKNYFLNFPHDSLWIVYKLQFAKDEKAFLFNINEDTEPEIFEAHSNMEVIRNKQGKPQKYIIDPSREEWKTLLRLETFSDTTEFIRISR